MSRGRRDYRFCCGVAVAEAESIALIDPARTAPRRQCLHHPCTSPPALTVIPTGSAPPDSASWPPPAASSRTSTIYRLMYNTGSSQSLSAAADSTSPLAECLGREVLDVRGDDHLGAGGDGSGEDVPVVGVRESQCVDEWFVADDEAVSPRGTSAHGCAVAASRGGLAGSWSGCGTPHRGFDWSSWPGTARPARDG